MTKLVKFIKKICYTNEIFFMCAACCISIFGTYLFYGHLNKHEEVVEVSVESIKTEESFNEYDSLTLLSVEVDGKRYSAQELFDGNWSALDGGKLFYDEWNNENPELIGSIPAGTSQRLIFQGNRWSGCAKIRYNKNEVYISTYVYGESQEIPVDLVYASGCSKGAIGCFITLFTIIAIIYVCVEKLFFAKFNVIERLSKKKLISRIIFIVSGMVLTAIITLNSFSALYTLICLVGAFPIYTYFSLFLDKESENKNIVLSSTLAVMCSLGIFYVRYTYVYLFFLNNSYQIVTTYLAFFLSFYSVWKGIQLIVGYIVEKLKLFAKKIDSFEKKYILITEIIISVFLILLYSHTSAFSNGLHKNADGYIVRQYADIIYGYDHSWLLDYYSTMDNHIYNIKHPAIYVFFFPFACLGKGLEMLISPLFPQIYGLYWGFISAQCMIFCALLLKRIVKKEIVAILYSSTFFFWILCLGSEQYQVSIMFILIAIYQYLDNKEVDNPVILFMSGTTLTSGHLVPVLIKFSNLKDYLCKLGKYCLMFIGLCCMSGTMYAFSLENIKIMLQPADNAFDIIEKLKIYTHFVVWNFVSPNASMKYSYTGLPVYTADVPQNFSIIGGIIILLCMISFVKNRKHVLVRISAFSVLFSIVLCVGLGWALGEAWLYCILFSWAYIVLLYYLFTNLSSNTSFGQNIDKLLVVIIILLIILNAISLGDILRFCIQNYSAILI